MAYAPLQLDSKVAVIIGGTSGIGLAIAKGFAQAGATVVPTSRSQDHVNAAAEQLQALGAKTIRVTSDVTDIASLQNLYDQAIAAFGRVDILVNSAGRTKKVPTLELTEDDWNAIMETNLTGTLRACRLFGRQMVERRYGRIINIASIATFVSLYQVSAYSASKAAVGALTKSLAIEWAPYRVCVNAIAPGVFLTPLNEKLLVDTERGREFLMRTPMKRFGNVEELAGAAIFLASDAASFVTGELLVVDGGMLASGVNH